jgi:precorrin-6A/cobalt-precorrin-6A reductase
MSDLSHADKRPRILILGGTGDACEIAKRLSECPDIVTISSLAGRLTESRIPQGLVRTGGFGGVSGLASYLASEQIHAVIDATHPFAAKISRNAESACTRVGVPLIAFARPPWAKADGDLWHEVSSVEDAAKYVTSVGGRVFLAIGRQEVNVFAGSDNVWFLLRAIEAPETVPRHSHLILQRGPFQLEDELSLLLHHGIACIVSKNSGGPATYPKIEAARTMGLPVVMISRPLKHTVATLQNIDDVLAAITNLQLRSK